MISVCLTTYNGQKYIEEQLNSIAGQLMPGDEVIISDDGSSDNTLQFIEEFSSRVEGVKLYKNSFRDPIKNFEFTLGKAGKSIIVLSDQDDVWMDTKLSLIRKELKDRKRTTLLMNGSIIDEKGEPTGQTIFQRLNSANGYYKNLWVNTFIGSSMAFTSDLLPLILPFPSTIAMHDWWIGLISEKLGSVILSEELSLKYRIHGENQSLGGSSIGDKINWRLNMHRAVSKRVRELKKSNK